MQCFGVWLGDSVACVHKLSRGLDRPWPPLSFHAPHACLLTQTCPPLCLLQDYADDYDLAEDEEVESYYFSSAAGRARVVLGNRRYGEGAPGG